MRIALQFSLPFYAIDPLSARWRHAASATLEQNFQQEVTKEKAPDMSHISHPPSGGSAGQGHKQLNNKPDAQNGLGRHLDKLNKKENNQNRDTSARMQKDIGAHNTGNSTRRADQWYRRRYPR